MAKYIEDEVHIESPMDLEELNYVNIIAKLKKNLMSFFGMVMELYLY